MAEVQVRGIIRYQSLLTASAARKNNGQEYDQKHYSVDILISKQDPILQTIILGYQAARLSKFPGLGGQLPPGANTSFVDLAVTEANNTALSNYWQMRLAQKVENGRPYVVNMQGQPIIDPAQIKVGDYVWVMGQSWAYDTGSGGEGCFLNGTAITGEKGEISVEALTSRPSAGQMFANIPGFVDMSAAAIPAQPLAAQPLAAPIEAQPLAAQPLAAQPLAAQPLAATFDDDIAF